MAFQGFMPLATNKSVLKSLIKGAFHTETHKQRVDPGFQTQSYLYSSISDTQPHLHLHVAWKQVRLRQNSLLSIYITFKADIIESHTDERTLAV